MLKWGLIAAFAIAAMLPLGAAAANNSAPADEYFGPTKMSVLGIRNTIQDTQIRASLDPDHEMIHYWGTLSLAHQALEAWAARYPHDMWIPRNAFLMARLFDHMHTPEGDAAAAACRKILFSDFAKTWFARTAQADVAKVGKQ